MDLMEYFEPVDRHALPDENQLHPLALGKQISCHDTGSGFPDLSDVEVAILGVKEDRQAPDNEGCALAPDYVRKYLYRLLQGDFQVRVADLGNIKAGEKVSDTYFAVKASAAELIKNNIIPLIIGGSQDITLANYQAYEHLGKVINIVSVDSRFDLSPGKEEAVTNTGFLSGILSHKPSYLFNYANLGYQTYFVDQDAVALMEKLHFDICRLGVVRQNLAECEPVIRNADLLSFDVSAIRQSDAPANPHASPNGLYGEEACQLVRYAGMSEKLSSIGFYELNPAFDQGEQTAHLLAQMIWHFLDGFHHRSHDVPYSGGAEPGDFIRYTVSVRDFSDKLVFLKSKKSDRWWMEVPFPASAPEQLERHCVVPCSYSDYQAACREEIPEKWWQVYQKLL